MLVFFFQIFLQLISFKFIKKCDLCSDSYHKMQQLSGAIESNSCYIRIYRLRYKFTDIPSFLFIQHLQQNVYDQN